MGTNFSHENEVPLTGCSSIFIENFENGGPEWSFQWNTNGTSFPSKMLVLIFHERLVLAFGLIADGRSLVWTLIFLALLQRRTTIRSENNTYPRSRDSPWARSQDIHGARRTQRVLAMKNFFAWPSMSPGLCTWITDPTYCGSMLQVCLLKFYRHSLPPLATDNTALQHSAAEQNL